MRLLSLLSSLGKLERRKNSSYSSSNFNLFAKKKKIYRAMNYYLLIYGGEPQCIFTDDEIAMERLFALPESITDEAFLVSLPVNPRLSARGGLLVVEEQVEQAPTHASREAAACVAPLPCSIQEQKTIAYKLER